MVGVLMEYIRVGKIVNTHGIKGDVKSIAIDRRHCDLKNWSRIYRRW